MTPNKMRTMVTRIFMNALFIAIAKLGLKYTPIEV